MNIYTAEEDVFESLKTMDLDMSFYHDLEYLGSNGNGYSQSEETKKKISESLKGNTNKIGKRGYKQSDKFKEKCKARFEKDNPAKRPEVREKLRQAALRRYAKES